jgi:hypothetical protein
MTEEGILVRQQIFWETKGAERCNTCICIPGKEVHLAVELVWSYRLLAVVVREKARWCGGNSVSIMSIMRYCNYERANRDELVEFRHHRLSRCNEVLGSLKKT